MATKKVTKLKVVKGTKKAKVVTKTATPKKVIQKQEPVPQHQAHPFARFMGHGGHNYQNHFNVRELNMRVPRKKVA